jgi:hypothetical protein
MILMRLFDPNFIATINSMQNMTDSKAIPISYILQLFFDVCFYLTLPFAGLFSDMKLGHLNSIMITASINIVVTSFILVDDILNTQWISLVAPTISEYCHKFIIVVILSLGADQLIDPSSMELSNYVWWYAWSMFGGWLATAIAVCAGDSNNKTYKACLIACNIFCMFIIVFTGIARRKAIVQKVTFKNPLKSIINVLCFARKHKFPLSRSALTYWESHHPSRINLGKTKYGGPYTEEEVEGVKAFFRMLPLIAVITIIYLPHNYFLHTQNMKSHCPNVTSTFPLCLVGSTYATNYIFGIVIIPICSCCRNRYTNMCNVTMLHKICLGYFVFLMGKVLYSIIFMINNDEQITVYTSCYFNFAYIIPDIVAAISILLVFPAGVELIFAQAPYNMRGLLIGFWFTCNSIHGKIGTFIGHLIFEVLPSSNSSYIYLLMFNLIVAIIALCLIIIVSLNYKLRIREEVFNGYAIVEKYYTDDLKKRQLYRHYGSTT